MEFYNIWQTKSGFIGINKLTLGDLGAIQLIVWAIYLTMIALLIMIAPSLFIIFYFISFIFDNNCNDEFRKSRIILNILGVVSVIYFLCDYHFNLFSHQLFVNILQADSYQSIASFNFSIGILNIILFFVGHELYDLSRRKTISVLIMLIFITMGGKLIKSTSSSFVKTNIIEFSNDKILLERLKSKESFDAYDKQAEDYNKKWEKEQSIKKEQEKARIKNELKKYGY